MDANDVDPRSRTTRPNDPDEAAGGRTRVSRACTRCRARKDRCDGLRPRCSNCANAGQLCLYVAGHKKRGLPEGYVRGIEKLWAVMLQKISGLDETARQVMLENEDELLRIWNHPKHGDNLHNVWKESSILSNLERLLSQVDQPSPVLKRKRNEEDDGSGTETYDPDSRVLKPAFCVKDISEHFRNTVPQAQRLSHDPNVNSSEQIVSASLPAAALQLPKSSSTLLHHYFTYTHCWFPVLDRSLTLKRFHEHTRNYNSRPLENCELACLWAICAYSKQQRAQLSSSNDNGPSVDEMRSAARSLIPSEEGPFTIEHVQALLIIALLDVGLGKWTSAWMLSGFAVRAYLDITSASGNLVSDTATPGQQNNWPGTLQGCFVLDSIISMQLMRPPQLRLQDLGGMKFLDEDGIEEWEPWNAVGPETFSSPEPAFARSCFNQLTRLLMITTGLINPRYYQPTVFNGNRTLEDLAETFPFSVFAIEQRPPHQMLLQTCYLAVAARFSDPATRFERTLLFLQTLKAFDQAWNSIQCGIPSILIAMSHLPYLPSSISSPPETTSLSEDHQQVLARLSNVWPGFNTGERPTEMGSSRLTRTVTASSQSLRSQPNASVNSPFSRIDFWSNNIPGSQVDMSDASTVRSNLGPTSIQGYHETPTLPHTANLAPRLGSEVLDYGLMNVDMTGSLQSTNVGRNSAPQQPPNMGATTSPSYDGDEIDALFHEMAQLDANEWSMDRTQNFKDFGFSDASTFEAFCNDPDRLMLSNEYVGPGLSQSSNPMPYGARDAFGTGPGEGFGGSDRSLGR
ncbi:hypothetical protein PV08_04625 [Exophiala spinifera]|uniref:Zn(2)-C6 fungal-type domain-containing protein n=1 Tax=Exophiala spinifera TaxID=91928 RepID=A0A0D1YQB6_9EURO|nr:uncharacterized protein PV08_04625 [Exophiala spinifera]KIW17431.1 hypothetical protein PV08_04625 [Exophiala spinifera]